MSLIKEMKIGNSVVKIYGEKGPIEECKANLIDLYETIYDIADAVEKRGGNTSNWFYSEEEIKKLKKKYPEKFI